MKFSTYLHRRVFVMNTYWEMIFNIFPIQMYGAHIWPCRKKSQRSTYEQQLYKFGRQWVSDAIYHTISLKVFVVLEKKRFFKCFTIYVYGGHRVQWCGTSRITFHITKTCLYKVDPLKPHFYIVKLGFTGVYIIFSDFRSKHKLWVLVRTASPRRF